MTAMLTLKLSLSRNDCIRGQSVPFTLDLANPSPQPASDVLSMTASNEATTITAVARSAGALPGSPAPKPVEGYAMAPSARAGIHKHGPDEKKRITLQPGQRSVESGDLLTWLGELDAGTWELTARHTGLLEPIEAPPVALTVKPLAATALSAPRHGNRSPLRHEQLAWAHAENNATTVFLRSSSDRLPRVPLHCWPAAHGQSVTALVASTLASSSSPFAHALWQDRGKHFVASVDPKTGDAKSAPIKSIGKESALASPLSLADGSCAAVFADEKRSSASFVLIGPGGDAATTPIDLGGHTPFGPESVCWDLLSRLHLAYVDPAGRAVWVTSLSLDDPAATQLNRRALTADGRVLFIDMYLDPLHAYGGPPTFEHQVPPDGAPEDQEAVPAEYIWCAVQQDSTLLLTHGLVGGKPHRVRARFDVSKTPDIRVISSTRNSDDDLCLILADSTGQLHYASASLGTMTPLAQAAGASISAAQQPVLLAASREGVFGWVHVAYIDPQHGRVSWAKIEPPGEQEPRGDHRH